MGCQAGCLRLLNGTLNSHHCSLTRRVPPCCLQPLLATAVGSSRHGSPGGWREGESGGLARAKSYWDTVAECCCAAVNEGRAAVVAGRRLAACACPRPNALLAGGRRIETLSWSPRAFLHRGFLTPEECDYLIEVRSGAAARPGSCAGWQSAAFAYKPIGPLSLSPAQKPSAGPCTTLILALHHAVCAARTPTRGALHSGQQDRAGRGDGHPHQVLCGWVGGYGWGGCGTAGSRA